MDDTRTRIMRAAIKGVREYGLEGVRIQNISALAGLSPGALYRYFKSKDELMLACFTWVDLQVAKIYDGMSIDPKTMAEDPFGAVKCLWLPYFRFWTRRPDETIFYHRFRDSQIFPEYDRHRDVSHFNQFGAMVEVFYRVFPRLRELNRDILWIHVLNTTLLYTKYVVQGALPDSEETEDTIFQLIATGLTGFLVQA